MKKVSDPDNKLAVDPDAAITVEPVSLPRIVITDIKIYAVAIAEDGTETPVVLDGESFLLDNLQVKKRVTPPAC